MRYVIIDEDECPRCKLPITEHQMRQSDGYDRFYHVGCWHDHQDSQSEKSFERSLSGDDGGPSLVQQADRNAQIARDLK